jgi:hypothetical protein
MNKTMTLGSIALALSLFAGCKSAPSLPASATPNANITAPTATVSSSGVKTSAPKAAVTVGKTSKKKGSTTSSTSSK